MGYRREHIRIPVSGSAVLSSRSSRRIHTEIINISEGGLGLTGWPPTLRTKEYLVHLKTRDGSTIQFMGSVVHHSKYATGLKMVAIDPKNLNTLHQLIEDFQTSEEFIHQIGEKNIITDWFVDENGDELVFNFESPN